MARSNYQNTFAIDQTRGEAALFFGAGLPAVVDDDRPRLTIAIDTANNVTFTVERSRGSIDFAAAAQARYLDTSDPDWLDGRADIIIGDVFHGDSTRRQLFLLWVRTDPNPADPRKNLRLGLYLFHHGTRLSCGGDGLFPAGVGQTAGGASGGGPH